MKTTKGFEAYERSNKVKRLYEVEYGTVPRARLVYRIFAESEFDAMLRVLDIFPDAIIYDSKVISR